MLALQQLLPDLTVFERGWLSSNNLLFIGTQTSLVDSGYATHAEQTLDLVRRQLQGRSLDLLVNTHLHSDHCGGNAALQAAYPQLRTLIPPGHADQVARWDAQALSYQPTGQQCPRFTLSATLQPGETIELGQRLWQAHAAPGHDPHSLLLFQPDTQVLISADALWENGFGVVFPVLDGVNAFAHVAATLDLIERLQPVVVVPGHGSVFGDVARALAVARRRLEGFVRDPQRHTRYAAKALLKFKLLELQQLPFDAFCAWAMSAPIFETMRQLSFADTPAQQWLSEMCNELVQANAARREDSWIYNV